MPVIRDISWTFESSNADAGITIPMPAYEDGDLLLAFVQSDTGTPGVNASGWTNVFARTNTTSLTVLRKIATGSAEPATVAFAASVAETYNGAIVSIRDVDKVNPINVSNDTTQASAAKYTFQNVTTTRDKCLLLFAGANSAVGVPSIIEGPVTGLLGADGAAESQGIGWSFQHYSGSTSNISPFVSCSNVSAGAGVKAVIAINPPTGTIPVIPAYCANDNSRYINPIHGVTAYNTNAAFAATADTLFGTILSGTTVVDATVAAAADVGLNSFHSLGQMTTPTATANWGGAALDLAVANNINVTGKNVLVHLSPSTPGQLQRFPPISSNKKGAAFGMLSTAGNYKIWYVHGNGSKAWSAGARNIPIVINSSNTTGILSGSGTLNAAAVDTFGFWVSSAGVSTTIWQWGSLWMLDTTTVAGGCEAEPVDIAGIVRSAASGHERASAILQGANQMIVYQPIQFGASNFPIYMNLDSTAIEFPRQFSLATKEINYCSVDNVAGLTYYGSSGDVLKHVNSIISSPSRYHWRLHASSSSGASYDFSGLTLIGAGDVQLRAVTTFDQMNFLGCGTVMQNSASLTNCTFSGSLDSPAMQMQNLSASNCTFNSKGTGHAIELTVPGTYSFVGNVFNGYGATGTTDAAIFNNSSGSVTINVSGGGSIPTYRNGTGASTTVNNNITITLTGLKNPSEVRVYQEGTTTEIAGEESITDGEFSFSVGASVAVDISILSLGYQNQRILNYSSAVDANIPITQQTDRQYQNP